MLPCILSDRLWVPEQYVKDEHLDQFIYYLDDDDDDYGELLADLGQRRIIKTFTKVRNSSNGVVYFGFARGNIAKIGELYGEYPWIDKTAAPKLRYNLQFTKELFNYAEHGRGQQEAAEQWLKSKGGVIKAAPRFGKTILSIHLIIKLGLKALIITHQKDLLDQFYSSIEFCTNVGDIWAEVGDKFYKKQKSRDATHHVIGYFQDYDNPEELDICLLCWQTFNSKYGDDRIATYGATWGFVVVDEIHRLSSVCPASVINKLQGRYRLGLTGTVARVDGQEFLLKDVIGPVSAKGKVKQVPCKVYIHHTNVEIKYSYPREPIQWLYARQFNSKERQDLILFHLRKDVKAGKWICIAFHGSKSAPLIKFTETLKNLGYSAESFYGTMPKDRDATLQSFRDGTVQIAVCNRRMLTGIDVPRWDMFYNMFPTSNVIFDEKGELSGNYYQEYSRVRTIYPGKKFGTIRDFIDRNNMCYGSYRKRMAAYTHENFEIISLKERV